MNNKKRFGRYEVIAPLASGGMGEVYLARLRGSGGFDREVALKVLRSDLEGSEAEQLFLDEARIASRIQHPNVVQVYDVGTEGGQPFLVMELVRGAPLCVVANAMTKLEHAEQNRLLVHVFERVAEGLHAAHETCDAEGTPLDVVHRDVSPQNVLIGAAGEVKVTDFGIALARARATRTQTGALRGKFRYVAPEQIESPRSIDRRADLWSLGVMMWETLARRPLFADETEPSTLWNVLHRDVPPLEADAIPAGLRPIVAKCLQREPAGRYATGREVADALVEVAASLPKVSARDLASFVARVDRIRSTQQRTLPATPPDLDGEPDEAPTPESERSEATMALPTGPRRAWGPIVAALFAGGAIVLLIVNFPSGGDAPAQAEPPAARVPALELEAGADEPPATRIDEPTQSLTNPAPAPGATRIWLRVHPGIVRVTLDGRELAERPLELELNEDQSVELTVFSRNGTVERRTVTIADDGGRIAMRRRPDPQHPRDNVNHQAPGSESVLVPNPHLGASP